MNPYITENRKEFPHAVYFPEKGKHWQTRAFENAVRTLLLHQTRPAPERIRILASSFPGEKNREILDHAFALSELPGFAKKSPREAEKQGFDPGIPRLSYREVRESLEAVPENREWIQKNAKRAAGRFHIPLPDTAIPEKLTEAAEYLLSFLCRHVSFWEADAFPLEAMMDLQNRYDWTFRTDAWSLREQLRRESRIIRQAWRQIRHFSLRFPLLLILNECAPSDYMLSLLPDNAEVWRPSGKIPDARVLIYRGLKISSSEHREDLETGQEGRELEKALELARRLGRQPLLLDFSRRRFPRSFLRVVRFAAKKGMGIHPLGKVRDRYSAGIPAPKSAQGFQTFRGSPCITLCDPWPLCDPEITVQTEKKSFCPQHSKPWQDDRIGARTEREADEKGQYKIDCRAWVVPVLGGWMRADDLFKSRLARQIRQGGHTKCPGIRAG
ncbi:MAG: hypothetical protein V2I97_25240 [Desulfococcaceae bacterium]|jgi:hypothetical protein|nr:hypothetical protein [Desulfococcaceae bacterium]